MLQIYFGRENLEKERFLFDQIRLHQNQQQFGQEEIPKKTLILVPDQFTLQAERDAFFYLEVEGLIDIEIMSQSRLGHRVLSETGGTNRTPINQYGRHMLLTKILTENNEKLQAFSGFQHKASFVELANDFISELKQYNASPELLHQIGQSMDPHSILFRKLQDIQLIYEQYESLIHGKFLDGEDYLQLYASKIKESSYVKDAVIWINGFDYFSPKSLVIIKELIQYAGEVNVILTGECHQFIGKDCTDEPSRDQDLFEMTADVVRRLINTADEAGRQWIATQIPDIYQFQQGDGENEKPYDLIHLERELYAQPVYPSLENESIELCQAGSFYGEAETAAAKIIQLVRDENLRFRDILVICNDMEARSSVIKRVFNDYGIVFFIDKKRDILHHPAIEYLVSMLDIVIKKWQYEDVFRMLKTNLSPITMEETEQLEAYVVKYRIKGNRWLTPFQYGIKAEGEERLETLNEIREKVTTHIQVFKKTLKMGKQVKQKITFIYEFLLEQGNLPEKMDALMVYLIESGKLEQAEESAQIWSIMVEIFDQLVELIGEEELNNEEFSTILKSGFEAVEIGLLPPALDQVLVGTMQRTRASSIKALFVLGANDGLLPAAAGSDSLLNEDEKSMLYQKGIEICKGDNQRVKEEKLAIYKTFSKPSRFLWMGYSASDLDGKESKPSLLYERVHKIFPNAKIQKDILNQSDNMKRIESQGSTLYHMTEAFRQSMDGIQLEQEWIAAYRWYARNKASLLRSMREGLLFTNKQEKLEKAFVEHLYKKNFDEMLSLSPSRLERFSRCPFSHFINYGLHPEEQRIFQIAGREIGDVYHQCFMKLSALLSKPGVEITDPASPWMCITKEECQGHINRFVEDASLEYNEGVLDQGEEERYRSGRMKKVCGDAAWALVEHVQNGQIQNVFFESEFGASGAKQFPPIEVEVNGKKAIIEGKIDRVDVLPDPDGQDSCYIKVIDYKSGKETFDVAEAKGGWRLQLMLYLKAVLGSEQKRTPEDKQYKPAGVFYFEIAEPQIDATDLAEEEFPRKIENEKMKSFKLDGIVLDNPKIIESIAGEFSGYSSILPVRKTKEGFYKGTTEKKLLPEAEFQELLEAVEEKVEELCVALSEGSIEARPKKVGDETACKFCLYKSICFFDTSFSGCAYEVVT